MKNNLTINLNNNDSQIEYASIIHRLAANLIDKIIYLFIFLILVGPGFFIFENTAIEPFVLFFLLISAFLLIFIYKVRLEAGKNKGTLGMRLLGIQIVNYNFEKITIEQSFMRTLVYVLLYIIPFYPIIVLFMVYFESKKRAPHDYLAKTFVIRKN